MMLPPDLCFDFRIRSTQIPDQRLSSARNSARRMVRPRSASVPIGGMGAPVLRALMASRMPWALAANRSAGGMAGGTPAPSNLGGGGGAGFAPPKNTPEGGG